MLRLILLLLCTSQTFLEASCTKTPKYRDHEYEDVNTPQGVSDLNLSGLKISAGIDLNSPLIEPNEVSSPRTSSTFLDKNIQTCRDCGTPVDDLLRLNSNYDNDNDKKLNVTSPMTFVSTADSSSEIDDERKINNRHDSDLESDSSSDSEGKLVYLDSVSSSDSEYKRLLSKERITKTESATELNFGSPSTKPVRTPVNEASTARVKTVETANKTPAATTDPTIHPFAKVNVMNYRSIDSILKLNTSERLALTSSLHEQVMKSENFQSPIKFFDMPHAIFMYKISLIVRRYRKELLSRDEMESSNILRNTILVCRMKMSDLFEVIELLKRANRDFVSEGIVLRIVIPHLIHLHSKKDETEGEKLEKSTLRTLSFYGHILLLNELLKHPIIGKALRSHLNFYDIQVILEKLITNGTISDHEISETMELLLKGYDLEEFKSSKEGIELAELCETNRKELMK